MTVLKRNANLLKWLYLILAILSLTGRLIYGELYETTTIRSTGEELMDGSFLGYLLMGSTIVFLIGYLVFGQVKKKLMIISNILHTIKFNTMSKLIAFILFTSCALGSFSQTVKKEYYDYRQTQIMAEYQVNSVGEKHGWFKGYDREGVVVYEYNYKNGLWNGVNKEYSVYGGRTLAQSETYKSGVLNGSAIYYAGTGSYKGRFIKAQGSYLNGEKHGKWTYANSFDAYGMPEEWKSKAEYIQFDKYYENGKEVYPDGEITSYYLPSKQKVTIIEYKNNLRHGKSLGFYPDGSPSYIENYSDGNMAGNQIKYNIDGTIKNQQHFDTAEEIEIKKQKELEFIDSALVALENEEFEKAKNYFQAINYTKASQAMGNLVLAKNYKEHKKYKESVEKATQAYWAFEDSRVMDYYNKIYKLYISDLDAKIQSFADNLDAKGIETELKNQGDIVGDKDLARYSLKIKELEAEIKRKEEELKRKEEELKQLILGVNSSIDTYKTDNVEQVQTFLVDATTGKPIMKDNFVKGKFLYVKSMIVLEPLIKNFNEKEGLEEKKLLGKNITDAIDVLNNIPESEWKSTNKQLKKVDDPEQIKAILKI